MQFPHAHENCRLFGMWIELKTLDHFHYECDERYTTLNRNLDLKAEAAAKQAAARQGCTGDGARE